MQKFLIGIKGSIPLVALVLTFVALMIPMPGGMISLLIAASMLIAIIVYMMAASIQDWDELSTFPTLLMLTMVFRLMLNISTTRKILADGQPGSVIEAAGHFIVGNNVGIGVVMFIILIVFQFIIANGASRTSEVAARFTLDSLPGKQMSIDSDLQQGLINQDQAKEKRKKLDMEVDFYGNMDGAGKFIKGDVVAGVVFTFVNIIAGFIVGMTIQGLSFTDAAYQYTILTIGDGVVNQITSLMIAIASGMVMTRVYSGKKEDVTQGIFKELTKNPMVAYVAGAIFLGIGLLTPLPWFPFTVMAAAIIGIGYQRQKKIDKTKQDELAQQILEEQEKAAKDSEKVEVITEVEPITLEVGIALVPVVETEKEGETLKDKITLMRRNIAKDVGVKIPSIHVLDNSSLMPYTRYNILIKDNLVASGDLRVNSLLALKTPYTMREIEGQQTKDPIFGEDAIWISEDKATEAKEYGYTVLDPLSILSTHLNEMIRKNLHELIERQEIKNLLDNIERRRKVLIEEMNKEEIGLSLIQGVVQNLLREDISIRDLPRILEAIIDCKAHNSVDIRKVDDVTSIVREKLSKQICEKAKNMDGIMYIILPNSDLEQNGKLMERHDGYYLSLDAMQERLFIQGLIKEFRKAQMSDIEPVLLASRTDLRFALARLIQKYNIPMPVISTNELVPGMDIKHIATVEVVQENIV